MCEAHWRLVRLFFEEVVNQGNLALLDTIYAPNVVDHNSLALRAHGRRNIRHALLEVRLLLPDVHVVVDSWKANGDIVVTHETWRGIHAFSGRQIQGSTSHIFRIRHGKVIEEWSGGWEWLELLTHSCTLPSE